MPGDSLHVAHRTCKHPVHRGRKGRGTTQLPTYQTAALHLFHRWPLIHSCTRSEVLSTRLPLKKERDRTGCVLKAALQLGPDCAL